jgi:hypothetical protein
MPLCISMIRRAVVAEERVFVCVAIGKKFFMGITTIFTGIHYT